MDRDIKGEYELSQRGGSSDQEQNVNVMEVVEEPTPFEKYISINPIIAFGLSLQVSWETIGFTFQSVFINGGPAALVYGLLFVTLGSSTVAATLGEMASIDPAVGAQYRWAARFAPKSLRPHFWGFMQGWLTWVAWITACVATPYIAATVIQSLAMFNYPNYAPERWHVTLITWANIALVVTWNLWARKLLVALELIGGVVHVLLFFGTIITLATLAQRSPNEFVWKTLLHDVPVTADGSVHGWPGTGVAMCVGLLSASTTVVGFDGLIHMSGETMHAPRNVPRGMLVTVITNGLLAFGFAVCLMYTVGDPAVTFDPTIPYLPIITIIYQATKSRAATNVIVSFMVVVYVISGFTIYASVSRLTWAFARDGGLPFSGFFSKVNQSKMIPLNGLLLVAVCTGLLALINIGSTVAFYAIISLAVLALFISYIGPVIFLIGRKLKGERPRGPFQLGRYGIFINIFAACYIIFMIIWLPFPMMLPVTKDTMNYASPVWVGCMILALIDYFVRGRKHFKLPSHELRK